MPHTITLTGPRLRQGANMHPTLPPPQGPNQKRRFRLPHAQATRERKHQKQEEIGGQGAQGRSLEEFQNQVMHRIFDHLSDLDKEVEDRANGGREVTGVNANNHVGGDKDHRNRSCRSRRPAHAATKHTYKSNSRRLRDNQWEDRKPESHGSAGLAKQCVGEGHHVVFGYQNMRGNKEVMNGETEGHHQRTETGRTRIIASEFEGSKYNCYVDQDHKNEEVKRTRKMGPTKDELHEVLHDVVGDSDENGLALYGDTEDENRSPTEGDGHCADILQPMDVTRDKDMCCERESKHCGPPLNLVVPHIPPPGQPDRLKLIKVPNVVGINPKPFDPETYMEEDDFITDESNGKKSVHKNVVHCRMANNADGTKSLESNARFVQWKDGSMQLLIGDVALDVSVEESSQHTHLFRKNGKGLLQSQGRLLQKMRIMPPESSSSSHSSLTAPVDSQNKKTIEVQAWYDKKDHERMKQERERAEEKNIQARSILRKKKEKVNHKYTQSHKGKQKLTSGFFYEALDEDESPSSWYNPHGRVAHTGFEHDLEFEALAQRRIINAKVHEYYDSESEELEYETEFEDIESSPTHERENDLDENNVYDRDLGVSSLPNEELEGKEHKRGPRKGKVIDFGEEYPPKKRFLNRWRGSCY